MKYTILNPLFDKVTLPANIENVMADFFRHKNQHDALIQFAQFLVDLLSVC